jgi:hypothetical protein
MVANKSKTSHDTDGGASASAEERISVLFQPDTLVTHQYLDTYRRQLPLEPEQRLVFAVLEDGIHAFQDNFGAAHSKKRRLFEDAKAWIFTDDNDWIFAFSSICLLLNLDPDYVRRGLRQWQAARERSDKRAPAAATTAIRRRAA